MKLKYFLLSCLLVIVFFVKAQNIPSYVPTNGLVGWWPFNGNANDESGNGNHGTIVNGVALTTDRNGINNNAYKFNGYNHISVNHNSDLNITGNLTLSAWFLSEGPPNYPNSHTLISKRSSSEFHTLPYGMCINYQYGNSASYKKPIFFSASSSNGYQFLQSTNDITNNVWNHLVSIVNGNNLKIYLNNNLVLDTTINNILRVNNSANLLFGSGARTDLPSEQLIGSLDDIAIYNRALTQSEIRALYYNSITYNITSGYGPNGSITPTGTTTLNQGSSLSYTFTPNTGYLVDSVLIDGIKVDSIQGYTFSNISANHSIRITFKVDSNNVSMNFPTGISYQAIARDSTGKVLANSPIKLKFSIKENSMTGNTVYSETANLTTNKLGLFNCVIGNNNAIMGNYKNIDWMGASKFLQVELEQGNSFVLLGTQQLLSVPYANAAKEATKIKNAALQVYNSNSDALQGGLKPGEMYRTATGVLMIVY